MKIQPAGDLRTFDAFCAAIIAKLNAAKPGGENEAVAAPALLPQSVYISFVGTFGEADRAYKPYTATEETAALDTVDYTLSCAREAETCAIRHLWLYKAMYWQAREVAYKGSLTVTVYDDPLAVPGWGVVVADCPDGGWFEAVRVNLNSFVGGAAVPDGCAVRILGR
jgi:hypothetical protein